ncbi:MAG: ferrous iron transport protein A [Magnetococcales bacterium]|nr:ferrous iron transport protein A [Magnetococcales bacterium]
MPKTLNKTSMTLADIESDKTVQIVGLEGDDASKRRLMALGIVRGKDISLDTLAPFGDPRVYSILGYRLTIRNDDAQKILVTSN